MWICAALLLVRSSAAGSFSLVPFDAGSNAPSRTRLVSVDSYPLPEPIGPATEARWCAITFTLEPNGYRPSLGERCDTDVTERSLAAAKRWVLSESPIRKRSIGSIVPIGFTFRTDGTVRVFVRSESVRDLDAVRSAGPIDVVQQVRAKLRVKPTMPQGAQSLSGHVDCRVRLFIDAEGVPTDVKVEECPDALVASTARAAWQWRFYPYSENGVATPSQFVLSIEYDLR
jgi:hypothetical protein